MVLNWVMERGEAPLQEFVSHIDDLRELISRHLLRLKISMYAWGVEYNITRPKTPQGRDLEEPAKLEDL
jgi:hypothetical protein